MREQLSVKMEEFTGLADSLSPSLQEGRNHGVEVPDRGQHHRRRV